MYSGADFTTTQDPAMANPTTDTARRLPLVLGAALALLALGARAQQEAPCPAELPAGTTCHAGRDATGSSSRTAQPRKPTRAPRRPPPRRPGRAGRRRLPVPRGVAR